MLCGAIMWLIRADGAGSARVDVDAMSLQVVWIEQAEARDKAGDHPDVSDPTPRQVAAAAVARQPRMSVARDKGDDSVIAEPVEQGQLDLSLPAAPVELRQGWLERPGTIQKEAVLQVAFQDRSFGGMLQKMTRGGVCAELNRALVSHPGSYEAISSAMARHGCNNQD